MAEQPEIGPPIQLERMQGQPLQNGVPHRPPIQTPSFTHPHETPPLPFGTGLGGKDRFSVKGLLQSVSAPLEKLKGLSFNDMKLDDLILIGLILILLNEKSDYDILFVLAYLFLTGF